MTAGPNMAPKAPIVGPPRATRVVLYTDDMEPITVIYLTASMVAYLEERGRVLIPVYRPITQTISPMDLGAMTWEPPMTIDLRIEEMRQERTGNRYWFLVTQCDEAALLLLSELLPAQQHGVKEYRRQEFERGFLHALHASLR